MFENKKEIKKEIKEVVGDVKSKEEKKIEKVDKDIEIHSMPEKFLPIGNNKKMSSKKKMIIIIIIFILFLIISLGTMLYIASNSIKKEQERLEENKTEEIVSINTNEENINNNEEVIEEVEYEEEIINNNEEDINDEETEIIEEVEVEYTNLDEDQDDLTLLEEDLYNTDKNKKDTDNDEYSDGQEIINLYNPLASRQKLLDSGLISVYTNNMFKYNIFKPTSWVSEKIDEDNRQVMFLNNSETGEYIVIKVHEYEGEFNLNTWANGLIIGSDNQLENYNLGDKPALITTDGFNVFMAIDNRAYHIEYVLGELEVVNFATTFEMMLNSFIVLGNG